jgi:DnaJ-class molecular chaperone
MAPLKDPYQVLGVSKTATQDEIKNAYRGLAKKFHPDLNPGNKTAEEKFKDISIAYERIGTSDERAKFDRGETQEQKEQQAQQQYEQARTDGHAGGRRGPFYHETQQGGGRYSDFFEDLFREAGHQPPGDMPGEDHRYQMTVDFKDAVLGAEREVTLMNGKHLKVRIPPGLESGAKLRFKNQGGLGQGRAPAGDAYVEIAVKPLEGFKRVGNDIEIEAQISFIEAILGAEIKVPTLESPVMLKVPPGVSTGSRLRIRGKGVARHLDHKEPGDQIVVLKVVMPKKVDPGLAEAVRSWGDKYSYNPRNPVGSSGGAR